MGKNDFLGGYSISDVCFNFIREILPEGKTILELGSGLGTDILSKHYTMYSIEDNGAWINKYNSTYLHVPLKKYDNIWTAPNLPGVNNAWFNPDILKQKLKFAFWEVKYDLILVDGPSGFFGRGGFFKHLDLFDTNVPIIIDDIHREEMDLMIAISNRLNKPYKTLDKYTGYIL